MGERGPDGAGAGFRWNYADLLQPSGLVDALPCAQRGGCAHGSASTRRDGSQEIAESCGKVGSRLGEAPSPMCNPFAQPLRASVFPAAPRRRRVPSFPVPDAAPGHGPPHRRSSVRLDEPGARGAVGATYRIPHRRPTDRNGDLGAEVNRSRAGTEPISARRARYLKAIVDDAHALAAEAAAVAARPEPSGRNGLDRVRRDLRAVRRALAGLLEPVERPRRGASTLGG